MISKKSSEFQTHKVPSDTLYVRIGSDLQGQVEKASELANQTKTAWVSEVLKQATQQALSGEPSRQDNLSGSCEYLLHNPEKLDSLVEAVKSDLASETTIARLKFIGAVEKLVIGLDAVEPLLRSDKPKAMDRVLKEVLQRLRPLHSDSSGYEQPETGAMSSL